MSDFLTDKEPRELVGRIAVPTVIICLAFLLLIARLWYLQVMVSPYYKDLAKNNRIRLVKSSAPRGLILDRYGARLAENRPGFDLMIVPQDVKDWDGTIKNLVKLVDIKDDEIKERLKNAHRRPPFEAVKIKGDLSWEEMVRIEGAKFKLPGVELSVGPKRTYPSRNASAHLIGYLGEISEREIKKKNLSASVPYRAGEMTGKYGIERSFEDKVRGVGGGRHIEVDVMGREIRVLKRYPPKPGNDLHTTIDLDTQMAAWTAMQGKAGAVVAMEPDTGEILALISTPSFNPDSLTIGVNARQWKEIISNPLNVLTNRAIQGLYPPASTFKVITASAALEEGVVTPEQEIFSGDAFRFAGRDYRDWKKGGHGKINIHRAIVESSDTFFYQVGLSLGISNISKYARGFGLGKKTGIDLKDEKRGLVPSSAWKKKVYSEPWYQGETLSVAVGQGFILTTPLQMASAFSAIANGGTIYKPIIIKKITSPEGEVIKQFKTQEISKIPLSTQTIKIIRDALKGVVWEDGGTARVLRIKGIEVAGKTGTAQVVALKKREKDINKILYKYRDHGWFVGFAPFDHPRIVVAVIVEHGGFGSRSAGPVARAVIKAYLHKISEIEKPEESHPPVLKESLRSKQVKTEDKG